MAIATFANLFAVLADPKNLPLARAIEDKFPDSHIQIRPGEWFVVDVGRTAKEISEKLEVTPGSTMGSAVIVAVSGYYGRAGSQIWEWVAAKVGRPANA